MWAPISVFYGGTERQKAATIMGVEWLTHSGSVGRIQGEDQLKILDERSEECKLGEVGEIFFKIGWGARLDLRRLDVGTFPNKLHEACRSAANMAKLSSKNCESVTFLQPANR